MFQVLKKLDLTVNGDIGCCTLAALPPCSTLIPLGSADVIVSFELLESLWKIEYLAPEGEIPRQPGKDGSGPGCVTGSMKCLKDIEGWLKGHIPGAFVLLDIHRHHQSSSLFWYQ
ncbi:hypothetical cytosolic protein [Syntrophus aciditrophicus SB]|uniref:Hypothetical cytosolic protein n=1 Tax=Syntrophus aciditrophicus (strain SB) TaxID=56780 RepID=Q2LWD1_SYNAS|nr:hypothetical cytosolic protein [Syntrophus aciditrophicus SB]